MAQKMRQQLPDPTSHRFVTHLEVCHKALGLSMCMDALDDKLKHKHMTPAVTVKRRGSINRFVRAMTPARATSRRFRLPHTIHFFRPSCYVLATLPGAVPTTLPVANTYLAQPLSKIQGQATYYTKTASNGRNNQRKRS
eukprot:COSAG01_NODE_27234_length_690_cov_8.563452_1_plen_138_part_01